MLRLDLLLLFHQGKRRACLPQAERLSALVPAIAVASTGIIFTFQFLRLEGLILIEKIRSKPPAFGNHPAKNSPDIVNIFDTIFFGTSIGCVISPK